MYKFSTWCDECYGKDVNGCYGGKSRVGKGEYKHPMDVMFALSNEIVEMANDGCCAPKGQIFKQGEDTNTDE